MAISGGSPVLACLGMRLSPFRLDRRVGNYCTEIINSSNVRVAVQLQGGRMSGTTRTKAQLGLGQIGLLQIGDRNTVAIRCSLRTTVANFPLEMPVLGLAAPPSVFAQLAVGGRGGFTPSPAYGTLVAATRCRVLRACVGVVL